MKMPKDLKKIAANYKAKGWRIEPATNGHAKWFAPDGKTIVVSSGSPSGQKFLQSHVALLERTEKAMASKVAPPLPLNDGGIPEFLRRT